MNLSMCSCTASGYFSLNDFETILVEGELDDSKGDDLGEGVAFLLILVGRLDPTCAALNWE